jgi:hypothetical protein
MGALGSVEDAPRRGQDSKAADDDKVTEDVQGIEVRVTFPTQERVPQMSGLMREKIEPGIPAA